MTIQVGGGGAGAAALTAPGMDTSSAGGAGSAGRVWPYTGATYAGGGGGPNSGGAGGGGSGYYVPGTHTGSPGTGGGGGGGGAGGNQYPTPLYQFASFSGGSGTVILAVPTSRYPGSAPGAAVSTPPAAPGMTILTFTTSGTYTA